MIADRAAMVPSRPRKNLHAQDFKPPVKHDDSMQIEASKHPAFQAICLFCSWIR
jgi:hypothetical protein